MLSVYILESLLEPERFYVGITEDLRFRLKQHNAGEVFHTAKYNPWKLKNYFAFEDHKKAHAFERYLKNRFRQSICKKAF
jgi:putative endonuclease